MRNNLIIILIFLGYGMCYGNYDFNSNCKAAYTEIINLRFDKGKQLLETEKKTNPSNDIPYYIENYIDFLTLVIKEEYPLFYKLKGNKNARFSRLEDGDKSSPYYRLCLAELYLQWAFSRIKYKEYLAAVVEANKAYKLLKRNEAEFPNFILNKKGLGILHILIGSIPDEFQWIARTFSMDGNIKKGMEELESLCKAAYGNPEYSYLKTESSYILTFIYIDFWNDPSRLIYLQNLIEKEFGTNPDEYPPLVKLSLTKISMFTGKNDRAIELSSRIKIDKDDLELYQLDYLNSIARMNRLDNDAEEYFIDYLKKFRGQNLIKSANQKIGWCELIKGNTEKYNHYMELVKKNGNEIVDDDKVAEKEATKKDVPNVYLLKARLLCDGGYYEKAISAILEKKSTEIYKTPKDILQFSYRLARIYHLWKKYDEAIPYYEMTIKNGAESEYYYAANSCLELGIIYESRKDFAKAKNYFEKSMTMKNDEYRSSIKQKAKAGLKRIGN